MSNRRSVSIELVLLATYSPHVYYTNSFDGDQSIVRCEWTIKYSASSSHSTCYVRNFAYARTHPYTQFWFIILLIEIESHHRSKINSMEFSKLSFYHMHAYTSTHSVCGVNSNKLSVVAKTNQNKRPHIAHFNRASSRSNDWQNDIFFGITLSFYARATNMTIPAISRHYCLPLSLHTFISILRCTFMLTL